MMGDDEDWNDLNDGKVYQVIAEDPRRSVFVLGADGQGYPLPHRKVGFDLTKRKPRVRVKAGRQ